MEFKKMLGYMPREPYKETPVVVEITEVEEPTKNQWGAMDYNFVVQLPNGEQQKLTLWQKHVNGLVDELGGDGAAWKGKHLELSAVAVMGADGKQKSTNGNLSFGWAVKPATVERQQELITEKINA